MNPAPLPARDMRQLALEAFLTPIPEVKAALALALHAQAASLSIAIKLPIGAHIALPGRPARPILTHPAKVPRRSPLTMDGRAAMVHAICHIEFNAINTV